MNDQHSRPAGPCFSPMDASTVNGTPGFNVRFTISHCLTIMFVVAIAMGLLLNQVRHQRQVQVLRSAIDDSRSTLRTIEYGAANLSLLELNPAIAEDRDCSRFLKHELAIAILEHWRNQDTIDLAIEKPGYAIGFATNALVFFECESVDDFRVLTESELSVYPDDGLRHSVWELSETELASFDNFIRCAVAARRQDDS